jgi:hypothetical protein
MPLIQTQFFAGSNEPIISKKVNIEPDCDMTLAYFTKIDRVEDYEKGRERLGAYVLADFVDSPIKANAQDKLFDYRENNFDWHMLAVERAMSKIALNQAIIGCASDQEIESTPVQMAIDENLRLEVLYPEALKMD